MLLWLSSRQSLKNWKLDRISCCCSLISRVGAFKSLVTLSSQWQKCEIKQIFLFFPNRSQPSGDRNNIYGQSLVGGKRTSSSYTTTPKHTCAPAWLFYVETSNLVTKWDTKKLSLLYDNWASNKSRRKLD